MNREEKSATIQEIAAQIEGAEAIFAVDYRGISVPQAAELRTKLRETDSSFRVVKNRLTKLRRRPGGGGTARRSAGRADRVDLRPRRHRRGRESDHQLQQTDHDVLTFKGGLMGEVVLDEAGFTAIAKLPSREVLIGQFAGDRRQSDHRRRPRPERADPGARHAARPDRREGARDRRGSGRRRARGARRGAPAEAEAPAEEAPAAEERRARRGDPGRRGRGTRRRGGTRRGDFDRGARRRGRGSRRGAPTADAAGDEAGEAAARHFRRLKQPRGVRPRWQLQLLSGSRS